MTATAALPIVKGTLDVLILKALAWGPMHGFAITDWLETRSGGSLGIDDSALYQALHRMEERGQVKAEWGLSENNRKARYYEVTAAGKARLHEETARWIQYAAIVTDILTATARTAPAST